MSVGSQALKGISFALLLACAPAAMPMSGAEATLPDDQTEQRDEGVSSPGLRREHGMHYGSPLRLSAHVSQILPIEVDTTEYIEGIELHAEAGLTGVRLGFGWAERSRTYYNGVSHSLSIVRTFETLMDPLGVRENRTFLAVSRRTVGVGVTLRGELLYDLDADSHPWTIGWSVGLSW